MNELGRLEDLPADYVQDLRQLNLVPLWPSLRAVLPPGKPRPSTQATFWSDQALRPLLMRAGELTPMAKAERRVLVLANPGPVSYTHLDVYKRQVHGPPRREGLCGPGTATGGGHRRALIGGVRGFSQGRLPPLCSLRPAWPAGLRASRHRHPAVSRFVSGTSADNVVSAVHTQESR